MPSPVYTIENECQDYYKCVWHWPVKAIPGFLDGWNALRLVV